MEAADVQRIVPAQLLEREPTELARAALTVLSAQTHGQGTMLNLKLLIPAAVGP
jgi:hypothetical protein